MDTANETLRNILLLKTSLWDKPKFDDALSKLEAHLVTLTEEVKEPIAAVPGAGSQTVLPYPGRSDESRVTE